MLNKKYVRSIREFQKGYDPVCVNWEEVLSRVQDSPAANKYVFNF